MTMTIDAAVRNAAGRLTASKSPLLDARVLFKFASGLDDAGIIAAATDPLTGEHEAKFNLLIDRRRRGEPVAYITGVKEFWSLEFRVTADVLIPRDDSECLIDAATARRDKLVDYAILDLGTGSGCLLGALLQEFPNATGTGIDISANAAAVARGNIEALGFAHRAQVIEGGWDAGPGNPYDLIISNPPYIRESDRMGLPPDVRDYEPGAALFAGEDGFDAYRAILEVAPARLAKDGLLVLEAGDGQAQNLLELVTKTFPAMETDLIYGLNGRPRGVLADGKRTAKKD